MIVLIGFMGAGKTRVGRGVAHRLELPFVDADDAIVHRAGRPVAEIFAAAGEPAFRALEHETIAELLRGPATGVLSLGGGAAMHEGTQRLLRKHATTVHLRVSLTEALRRVGDDPARPMLRRTDLAAVHGARLAVYDAIADQVVNTDRRTERAVVTAVVGFLA